MKKIQGKNSDKKDNNKEKYSKHRKRTQNKMKTNTKSSETNLLRNKRTAGCSSAAGTPETILRDD